MKVTLLLLLSAAIVSCEVPTTKSTTDTTVTVQISPPKALLRIEPTKEQRQAEHFRFIQVEVSRGKAAFVAEVEAALRDEFALIGEARIQEIDGYTYYTQAAFRKERYL